MALKQADGVMCTDVDGDLVILDLNSGSFFGLDGIGKAVWEKIIQGCSIEAIVDDLNGEFEVTVEELAGDIRSFVTMLLERGLLIDER